MKLDQVVQFLADHRRFEAELTRICRIFFNTRYNVLGLTDFDHFGFVERFEVHKNDDAIFVSCGWKDDDEVYEDFFVPPDWFEASEERLVGYARNLRDNELNKEREEDKQRKMQQLESVERNRKQLRKELGLE